VPKPGKLRRKPSLRRAQMTGERDISSPEWRRLGGEEPHEEDTADERSAAAYPARGNRLPCAGEEGRGIRRRKQQGGTGGGAVETGRICRFVEQAAHRIVGEMETIAPDEPAVAPQLPGIVHEAPRHALTRGDASEDEDFSGQQDGVRREVDDRAAAQPGAIEEDRLQRQIFEAGPRPDAQRDIERGVRPGGAIDLLGRLSRDMCRGVGSDIDADGEAIAADEPARGGEENGDRRLARRRVREEDAQRIALIEMTEARAPVPRDEADLGNALDF
jgi:hypothetical protein